MSSGRRRTRSVARQRPMTRRTRTKIRRPKFLSLCRQLARPDPPDMSAATSTDNLLLLQDRDPHVACLLEPDDYGDGGGATLTALLGSSATAPPEALSPPSPASSSMNWDGDEDGLARRALRGRERWVFCRSSASSPSSSSEEVGSTVGVGVGGGGGGGKFDLWCGAVQGTLSLKLDYEEILTAWSDRGSLYIDGDGPQVVPELHDNTVFVEVGSTGNAWRVPEMVTVKGEDRTATGAAAEGNEAVGSREARVLRYKEKRRSRLFAKRIRYEVRKLNAEKRPRMKGRFVKRKDDE